MMKKALFIFLTVSIFVVNAQNKNALLPDQLVIYDKIMFDTISEYFNGDMYYSFLSSLHKKSSQVENFDFNELLIAKLTKGNIKVYNEYSFYNPGIPDASKKYIEFVQATPMEIKSNLGYSVDTIQIYDEMTDETRMVEAITDIDKNSLKGFVFYDEWCLDDTNFKFTKNVKAWSPVRVYQREDDWGDQYEPLYKQVGFIIMDEFQNEKEKQTVEKRMKLFCKTEYEYLLENDEMLMYKNELADAYADRIENTNSPFWNSYARAKFKNSIFNQALSGKSNAYDFESGNILTQEEIRKRAGEQLDTIQIEDPENPENWIDYVIKTEISAMMNQIKSVIFIEDWYIDEKTLRIKKIVKGVVPIRWYYDQEDFEQMDPLKTELFMINFNQ
jgi:hypothetical protein